MVSLVHLGVLRVFDFYGYNFLFRHGQTIQKKRGGRQAAQLLKCLIRENPCQSVAEKLDIQILHIQRILFDELAPRFHVFAHEGSEDRLALGDVLEPDR
jgi:hypothetical protein